MILGIGKKRKRECTQQEKAHIEVNMTFRPEMAVLLIS